MYYNQSFISSKFSLKETKLKKVLDTANIKRKNTKYLNNKATILVNSTNNKLPLTDNPFY